MYSNWPIAILWRWSERRSWETKRFLGFKWHTCPGERQNTLGWVWHFGPIKVRFG